MKHLKYIADGLVFLLAWLVPSVIIVAFAAMFPKVSFAALVIFGLGSFAWFIGWMRANNISLNGTNDETE